MGKTNRYFPSLKKGIVIAIISIILLSILIWPHQELILEISQQETGEVYLTVPVETDDLLTYEWIHSFEHIPWLEDFRVKGDGSLDLEEIRVAGFGAGIPENKGVISVKNGMVYMSDIHEAFDHIQWINSHTALQYIAINGVEVLRGTDMPHHEPIQLTIKRRFQLWRKLQ